MSLDLEPDVEANDTTDNDNDDDNNNDNNDSHVVLGLRLVNSRIALVAHIRQFVFNQISESPSIVVVLLEVQSKISILSIVSNTEVEHIRQLLGEVNTDLNNSVLYVSNSLQCYVLGIIVGTNVANGNGALINTIELLQSHLNTLRFRPNTISSGIGNQIIVIDKSVSLLRIQRHAVLRVYNAPLVLRASTVHFAPLVTRTRNALGVTTFGIRPITISGTISKNTHCQH